MSGDFNAELAETEVNAINKDITAALAAAGPEDTSAQFLPRKKNL